MQNKSAKELPWPVRYCMRGCASWPDIFPHLLRQGRYIKEVSYRTLVIHWMTFCNVQVWVAVFVYKVFEKAIKSALQKVNMGNISRFTQPQTRSLFSFLCSNDALVSLLTGYGRSLIYQICPVVAKELSNLEKQVPAEPILFVVSPMNLLVSDQTNWCERMGINACKVDMEMISTLLANEANAAYKTNCFFRSCSGVFG